MGSGQPVGQTPSLIIIIHLLFTPAACNSVTTSERLTTQPSHYSTYRICGAVLNQLIRTQLSHHATGAWLCSRCHCCWIRLQWLVLEADQWMRSWLCCARYDAGTLLHSDFDGFLWAAVDDPLACL